MPRFAEVLLPLSIPGTYTYRIAPGEAVGVGHRVLVPFGRKKIYTGIVTMLHDIEPKGYEVLDYVRRHYGELRFSEPVPREAREKADSPKRRQRAAAKEMQPTGVGTKSQQALQAQRELMKVVRKRITKAERAAEEQRRFELKQQKKKERKRGH